MVGVAYSAPQTPAHPNPATPAYPYQYSIGGWRGQGGYDAPVYPNTTTSEAQ
ncbi:MAG: hypothetical protein ACWGNP_01425 [Candidatus Bathyarchaeia archaeon]